MIDSSKSHTDGPYLNEKKQIIREIGDLEAIRISLGLSRRKISKLLLVDPSSWTRWSKPGSEAPAYIYRSLQWCLAIMEKYPEAHPLVRSLSYEKENKVEALSRKLEDRIGLHKSIAFDVQYEINQIKSQNLKVIKMNERLKLLVLCLFGLILMLGIYIVFRN